MTSTGQQPITPETPLVAIDVDRLSKEFKVDSDPSRTIKERLLAARSNTTSVHRALTDVSFTVAQGETFGVLGHNGSGKSTLLKIMAGTYQPTAGRVRIRGRLSALLELGAGFHPDLTGRENVYLNGSILGFNRTQIDGLFDDIVDFAGIEEFIDLQVKYYSSGMTARLGFAVATNLHPDVLLVDEVLAVGDEAFQAKCMERVHRFRAMGRTLVLVSHSAEAVRELCSRAVVLHQGRMLFEGNVNDAISAYREAVHGKRRAVSGTGAPGGSASGERPGSGDGSQDNPTSNVSIVGTAIVDPGAATPTDRSRPAPADQAQPDEEKLVFAPGDTVRVDIHYRVHQPTDFRIRLILRTEDNRIMVNASSHQILGRPLQSTTGDWTASFDFCDLPLLDGTYWLTAAVESLDGKVTHDRLHRLGQFEIKGPGPGYGRVQVEVGCAVSERSADSSAQQLGTIALGKPGEDPHDRVGILSSG
jgi:ABC-type polysaccharide/polyol phosphate transport system ATPase subunit